MRLAVSSLFRCTWKPIGWQVYSTTTTTTAAQANPLKRYSHYTVFKGRAALSVSLVPGTFKETQGGEALDRRGVLMFEFAPKIPNVEHQYDWKQKVSFALNVTECGEVLAGNFGEKGLAFMHNQTFRPGLEDSNLPIKSLRVSKAPDGKGFFLAVSSGGGASLSLPLSNAEFEVLRILTRFSIPRMLGFE
eukprot:EG_transcript_33208